MVIQIFFFFSEKKKRKLEDNKSQHDSHLTEYDPEIYDDGDFYQQILKEVVENGKDMLSINPLAESAKVKQRIKKKKANKKEGNGRRLNYQVHEKLVGFMTPKTNSTDLLWSTSNLFSSLFSD